MELTKLTFNYIDEDKKEYRRTLTGEDVQLWHRCIIAVCQFADSYSMNPDWQNLNWKTVLVNKRQSRNSRVLDEILEQK